MKQKLDFIVYLICKNLKKPLQNALGYMQVILLHEITTCFGHVCDLLQGSQNKNIVTIIIYRIFSTFNCDVIKRWINCELL